jgi:PRTRC genetic system protein C
MSCQSFSEGDAGWKPLLSPDHPLADLVNPADYREFMLTQAIKRNTARKEGKMARIFVYDGREFPDPDSNLTPDEVRKMMTDFFPELANAEIKEQKREDDTLYELVRKVGTKGRQNG